FHHCKKPIIAIVVNCYLLGTAVLEGNHQPLFSELAHVNFHEEFFEHKTSDHMEASPVIEDVNWSRTGFHLTSSVMATSLHY
ncbi:hypothetical protein C0J52_20062, partial [Blattella germanica]